jgi:hypothetical protein
MRVGGERDERRHGAVKQVHTLRTSDETAMRGHGWRAARDCGRQSQARSRGALGVCEDVRLGAGSPAGKRVPRESRLVYRTATAAAK